MFKFIGKTIAGKMITPKIGMTMKIAFEIFNSYTV